jgi:hypothetical protein
MGRIITTLYGSNLGCDEQPTETVTVTSIIQFGQELTDWQNNLPPQLSLRSSADLPREGEIQDLTTERVRLILTLRYLNVQLLLHRPTFIRSLGALLRDPMIPTRNPAPVNHMQSNFDRTFVQVAENIIEIIYTVLTRPDLGRHLIGAWWFSLYYGRFHNDILDPDHVELTVYSVQCSTGDIWKPRHLPRQRCRGCAQHRPPSACQTVSYASFRSLVANGN